ncbi:histidine kinase dimerization/phospho-acceptor domain-containing protein [Paraclostridium sp. AKS81]|uniref:histidine kinase dimerization/phospho-acceptor domain-containing protein n=1 Tax=Paraclostridium sp. AKS81 TaxID=2876117 RepID=UPI0021E0592B|nr:histidine kinase dimerization/phospho-acceptor domain-containing protein [Paraclostridium sp. AKS81]MCU9813003.1 HAMP domain-containing protein [Paraclostridium sp. AKS81]
MFLGANMKSIKNKLLTGIILINSMMLVGILIFTISFKDIYIKYTSLQLDKFSNEIKVILNESLDENTSNKLLKLTESKVLNLDIYNKEGNLVFKNRMSMNNHMMGKMKNKYEVVDKYYINRNLTSYIIHENSENIEFLSIISSTDDNLYTIVIKTPISLIENSIKIASSFLIIIFIPIIIISIIMAIIFSIKFTKPIRKLNEVTDKISNLDFNERVDIKTNDEIEKLGQSINKLSDKINSSLNDLKYKNDELEVLIKNKEKQENLRREFVSSVSHELKTPITVISGYALGLKSNVAKSYEDREYYIDVIYEESEKMGVLVKDLLDLYKLESKTFSIKKNK